MTLVPLPDGAPPRHAIFGRPRVRTVAVAVVALVLLDLAVGLVAARRDVREAERQALDRLASQIDQHDAEDPTMLVLATDNVERLLDLDVVTVRLGGEALVEPARVEGSVVLWRAAYRHVFVETDRVPDVVAIAFLNDQLTDQRRIDWSVVGHQYTGWGDIPDAWAEAPDLPARLDVAASRVSSLVGHRSWLTSLWADALPSHSTVPRREPIDPDVEPTYDHLGVLLEDVRESGATPVLIALPTVRSYELDEALQTLLDETATPLVDLRVEGADPAADLTTPSDVATRSAALSDAVLGLTS